MGKQAFLDIKKNSIFAIMKAFSTYINERGKHRLNPGLLWEYRLDNFDWYAAFDLYGGIRGFRKIACDEVVDLSPRDLEFMCRALNIEKTETRCYKQAQSRKALLGDLPYVFDFPAVERRIIKMTDYPDKVYITAPLKRL